jgi:hypothetical protein
MHSASEGGGKVNYLRLFVSFSIVVSIAWLGKVAYDWKSPFVNQAATRNIHNCIHDGPHKTDTFQSMGHPFVVDYIEHAGQDCVNPHFPVIHITTNAEHNAWLQVVRTDCCVEPTWRLFVAATDEIAPFYSFQQDFYDAPSWTYTLFFKPLSYWKGHAYAVKVDYDHKTIHCVGGIAWGYTLSYFRVYPQMSRPSALTLQDWQKDWLVFKTAKERMLFDYTDL